MGVISAIEWTDATWNPVTGCTKVSRGCDNCYAERFANRFRGTPGHPFENGFDLMLRPERLAQPLAWRRPRRVFVNSMSDLFHKKIPTEFIDRVFDTMEAANRHIFQVLTKRSSLMRNYLRRRYGRSTAPRHIWCGVSVEDRAATRRIRHLQGTPAEIRFLSIEPLLGPVGDIDLEGSLGSSSAGRAAPMPDQCNNARSWTSGICATEGALTSSSSNGVAGHRSLGGEGSRESNTTPCPVAQYEKERHAVQVAS